MHNKITNHNINHLHEWKKEHFKNTALNLNYILLRTENISDYDK